jgi:hypothetical protein
MFYNNIFIILIYIFIIFSIIFTIVIKPYFINDNIINTIEKFDNKNTVSSDRLFDTTLTAYKKNYDFRNDPYIQNYYNTFIDKYDVNKDKALLAFMCIEQKMNTTSDVFEIQNMIIELYKSFYIKTYDIYINNTTDIINKITDDIDNVLMKTADFKLKGPIYTLLYQAPFLRFNDEEISVKFDMNNMKPSYDQHNNEVSINDHPLFVKMLILYPYYIDYNMDGKIKKLPDDSGMNKFNEYFKKAILSRNKACFVECKSDNSLSCGCLNRSENIYKESNYYSSTCLNSEKKRSNYGMMYIVNSRYPHLKNKFLD